MPDFSDPSQNDAKSNEKNDLANGRVTELLRAWNDGKACDDELINAIDHELRKVAHSHLARLGRNQTLQVTELMNEAYLKLLGEPALSNIKWENRTHFYGIVSRTIRHILVDRWRQKRAEKRGGGVELVEINEMMPGADASVDLIELNEALEKLGERDPETLRLIELRYFGGLSIEETAECLGVSPSTVKRSWEYGRRVLRRMLT